MDRPDPHSLWEDPVLWSCAATTTAPSTGACTARPAASACGKASGAASPAARKQGARPGGTLDGAEALRQTEAMRFNDGQWALDYLDRMDELERRSMDLELLDAYEAAQRWPAIHQGPS